MKIFGHKPVRVSRKSFRFTRAISQHIGLLVVTLLPVRNSLALDIIAASVAFCDSNHVDVTDSMTAGGTYYYNGVMQLQNFDGSAMWKVKWLLDDYTINEETIWDTFTGNGTINLHDMVPPFIAPAGTHTITFVADSNNQVDETYLEYNNSVSRTFTVQKNTQTIYFQPIGDKLTTDYVGLAATASSGLPVSFAVASGLASISGGTNLSFTGAGMVSIVASQGGDANWNAAPEVTNTFNVAKAAAQVFLLDLSQTYDGSARTVTATTLPEGLTVEFTYDGSETPPVNSGSYAVTGTVNDVLCQGSAAGLLLVSNGDQTIDFPPIDDKFTSDQVELTAWASSGLSISYIVASGPATISNETALTFTGTGLVSVVASQAGDTNWNAAPSVTNSFNVWIPLEITTTNLPLGTIVASYYATLEAINGKPPRVWRVRSEVVAWGFNLWGEADVPDDLDNVMTMAGGWHHTLALKSDGTVAIWPGAVSAELSNVVGIAAGVNHSLALKSDGIVVGLDGVSPSDMPAGLSNVTAIAAGYMYSLALLSNGTVVAWGRNELGEGVVPGGLSNVTAIASHFKHNLALKSDGTVFAWGSNWSGESSVPAGLNNVVAIGAGHSHSVALKSDGTVVAWGDNTYGQTNVPSGLSNVTAIAVGYRHNLALKSDGVMVAWGINDQGQTTMPAGLIGVSAIAAGGWHSVALCSEVTQLPDGLTLSADGTISGTPTTPGTNVVTFVVQDGMGTSLSTTLVIVVVAKLDQTIDFPQIGDKLTTDIVGLAATASSGLPVSFGVGSGPATIAAGTNLTFTGTGTVSIVASQDGDANWNPAPEVTNTLTVSYALVGVTVNGVDVGMRDGDGWSYDGDILSIRSNCIYEISGESDHVQIVVENGVAAEIFLQDLNIHLAPPDASACAFSIVSNATVALTLVGSNRLTSGESCAGLQVPEGATLLITTNSTGILTAAVSSPPWKIGGAGIGGGSGGSGGTITILGGAVTAIGGSYSAGIGGGGSDISGGSGGMINIGGNATVTAIGGSLGAGIGGGGRNGGGAGSGDVGGSGGAISIGGNATVTAIGGYAAAGIGGGSCELCPGGSGGAISIGGNATVTAISGNAADGDRGGGAGIGGGRLGSGGTITISGGTVTATGQFGCGAGIGGGYYGSGGTITIMRCATVEVMGNDSSGLGPGLYGLGEDGSIDIEEELIITAGDDEANSVVVEMYDGEHYAFINPGPFVPVVGISDVPTTMMVGDELALTDMASPSNATFTAIEWIIKDAGATGATLNSNLLYCAQTGTVVLTATIINGLGCNSNYVQDIHILAQIPYAITATTGAGGTIRPSGTVLVLHGLSTNFLIESSNGFHIAQVLVDGTNAGFYTPQDITAEIAFSNVVGNHTLVASFNHLPTIVLTATPTNGVAPLRVAVDFSGSTDPDGAIARSEFDKDGDGLFETILNGAGRIVVTYPEPGIYTATGVVYDACGASTSSSVRIEVLGRNPEAVLTASPTNGAAPLSVSFDGTNSTAAANHQIVIYEWDFNGDGRIDRITATGLATYVYASPSNYQAVLRVTDDQGLTGSATLAIAVEPPVLVPPAVTLTASTNAGYLPLDVAFTAEATDDGQVVQYRWDFDGDGSIDLVSSNNAANYRYTVAGTYNARVVVVDSDGLSASDTVQIQVSTEPEKYKVWLTQPKDGDRIWGNQVTIDGHVAPAKDTVSVQFQYKPEAETVWLDLGAPTYPQPRDYKTAWDVTGLADGATYHLRAVASLEAQQVATSGVYAVIVDSSEDKTPGKVKEGDSGGVHTRQASFDSDQTLNTHAFDGTGVVIPAGTVESNTTVEIVLVGANTNDANGSAQGQANINANRKVSLESDPELSQMMTITIPYPDADQDGYVDGTAVPELTLTVHWYDTASGQWRKAYSSTVYPDDNYVQAVVHHLTEFGVFGTMNLLDPANGGVLEMFTSESPDGATKALNLTDGNTVSYWRSEGAPETSQVFVYSFTNYMGAVLTKAVFNNYGDNSSRDFEVQASMDGINYDTVASGTLLSQESAQEFPIGSIVCRTVKLVVTSGAAADAWELAEFAVHGVMTDDPDGDGMVDAWEMQYFGDFSRDGTGDLDEEGLLDGQEHDIGTNPLLKDTDGDGQSDWAESIAGTSGTNEGEYFSIKEIGPASEGIDPFVLFWDSVTGRTYRLYVGPITGSAWSNVLQVPGDGQRKSYTNDSPAAAGFFRLTVDKP